MGNFCFGGSEAEETQPLLSRQLSVSKPLNATPSKTIILKPYISDSLLQWYKKNVSSDIDVWNKPAGMILMMNLLKKKINSFL